MAGKREMIEPHEGDKRYVRRDESGQFTESDDMNRSLSRDNDREAQRRSEPGQGDRGDQSSTGDTSRKGSSSSSSGSRKSGSPRGAAGRRNKGGMGGTGSGGGR